MSFSLVFVATQLVPGLATRATNDTPSPIFVDPAGSVASGTSGSMHRQSSKLLSSLVWLIPIVSCTMVTSQKYVVPCTRLGISSCCSIV